MSKKTKFEVLAKMCELVDLKIEYTHKLQNYYEDISLTEVIKMVVSDMVEWSDTYTEVLADISLVELVEVYNTLSEVGGAR